MRIYVGGFPYSTTQDELRELFERYGTVELADVVTDRFSGQSRGFGFVQMPNSGEAQAAISALNGSQFGGRTLSVNEARPKERGRGGDYR